MVCIEVTQAQNGIGKYTDPRQITKEAHITEVLQYFDNNSDPNFKTIEDLQYLASN
jgi:hypothetical protein